MWDKKHGALLFLNSFAAGLLSPLLTLLLLDKGVGLAAVPLAVGLHSATAVVFEVPSGMAADRWGRKNCFLLSLALLLPGLGLLALGRGMAAVLAAMVFQGLARAFSSGSLDALVVEEFLRKNGPQALQKCTARISILASIGLAVGCIAGGGVYALTGRLWTALALKGAVVLALLALSAGLTEHPVEREEGELDPVAGLVSTLRGRGIVRALVLYSAALAPAFFAVEVFYQPRFTRLAGSAAGWALGALNAGAYYAAAAGSALGPRLFRRPALGRLLALTALLGGGLAGLAAAGTPMLFAAAYFAFYIILGGTDCLTSTLMNEAAPPSQRATLLSAGSLALQLGGLAASPLLSAGAAVCTIPQVWLAVGGALAAGMLVWLAAHALRTRDAK